MPDINKRKQKPSSSLIERLTQLYGVPPKKQFGKSIPQLPGYSSISKTSAVVYSSRRSRLPALPGIVKSPGICGGEARLIRTRIPIWAIERLRQLGASEADILRSYPTLMAVDLAQAWEYVAAHPQEIARDIRVNESDEE